MNTVKALEVLGQSLDLNSSEMLWWYLEAAAHAAVKSNCLVCFILDFV